MKLSETFVMISGEQINYSLKLKADRIWQIIEVHDIDN